jgi:redox-sensing transcriptional repressor
MELTNKEEIMVSSKKKQDYSDLPKATARRLPQYYRTFKKLVSEGTARVNSQGIADLLGIESATVRRDFSYFGELGRRGYGYDTRQLRQFFADLLGDDQETGIALIGVGNLGRALINYRFHDRNQLAIKQAYDIPENPLVGTSSKDGIPVYDIDDLDVHLKDDDIKTAILSVQSEKAQEVTDELVAAGIKGILNFTPRKLKVPEDVVVQSVDLTSELQTLLFFMNQH